jgi:hypothetical protein
MRVDSGQISGALRSGALFSAEMRPREPRPTEQLTELWLSKLISGTLSTGKVSCRTFRVGQLRSRVFGLVTDPPEPFFPNTVFVNAVPANSSVLVEPETQHRIGRLTQVFV